MSLPNLRIRPVEKGDASAILDLYNFVFRSQRTEERWQWECTENPRGPAKCRLAFSDERLVGHSVGIPHRFRWYGREIDVIRIQNVMVHPDFRRRGLLPATLDALAEDAKSCGVEMAIGFPNDRSLPSMVGSCRYRYEHILDIPTYQAPLDGSIMNAERCATVSIEDAVNGFTEDDVHFMARALAPYAIVSVRDKAYLDWRYHPHSGKRYRIVRAFENGAQKGLAVVKFHEPTKTIDLIEVVFDDGPIFVAALREIGAHYAGHGALTMSTWSLPHYPLHARLVDIGFVVERSTHFILSPFAPSCSSGYREQTAFYISMGDSDVP